MTDPVRFHLDEHMSPAIAMALRKFGVDVTLTADRNLLGAPDESHIELCKIEARVIVTNDADFLAIAATRSDHSGIVYCQLQRNSVGDVIRYLMLLHTVYDPDELRGRVEYVS